MNDGYFVLHHSLEFMDNFHSFFSNIRRYNRDRVSINDQTVSQGQPLTVCRDVVLYGLYRNRICNCEATVEFFSEGTHFIGPSRVGVESLWYGTLIPPEDFTAYLWLFSCHDIKGKIIWLRLNHDSFITTPVYLVGGFFHLFFDINEGCVSLRGYFKYETRKFYCNFRAPKLKFSLNDFKKKISACPQHRNRLDFSLFRLAAFVVLDNCPTRAQARKVPMIIGKTLAKVWNGTIIPMYCAAHFLHCFGTPVCAHSTEWGEFSFDFHQWKNVLLSLILFQLLTVYQL